MFIPEKNVPTHILNNYYEMNAALQPALHLLTQYMDFCTQHDKTGGKKRAKN